MENKANKEIRNAARGHRLKLWQVAEALGMHDSTFSRKLRQELPTEEKEKILAIIDSMVNGTFVPKPIKRRNLARPESRRASFVTIPKPENNATQASRVLQYMRDFGSITPLEAMADLAVMRLAARIADLREAGYDIDSRTIQVRNRYGQTCNVAQYSERVTADGGR